MGIIMQLRPKCFDWKDEKMPNGVAGFIAQDVETVLPNAVQGGEGEKSISFNDIVAHLTKAVCTGTALGPKHWRYFRLRSISTALRWQLWASPPEKRPVVIHLAKLPASHLAKKPVVSHTLLGGKPVSLSEAVHHPASILLWLGPESSPD